MSIWSRREALVLGAGMLASGCGYALAGRGNSLPPGIVTIGVPPFENVSTTPEIDIVLTEAVRAEFQTRRRYRIVPDATGVDAVLTGRLITVLLQPAAFTNDGQVSRNVIVVIASIDFREVPSDRVIWSNPSFQARDEFDVTTGVTPNDASALFTQDANALERLSRAFARTVVTSIFEAF